MVTYRKLKMKPHQFQSFAGIRVSEFEKILERAQAGYEGFEQKRLGGRKRARKIGAGRHFKLLLEDQILLCLVHLRLNLTCTVMSCLFDLNESNVSRNAGRIKQLLEDELPEPSKLMAVQKKINSVEELFRLYPDLKAIVDGTEQPIERPKDPEKRKTYYSGKQKRHTIKKQVTVNLEGLILDAPPAVEGKRHDYKVFQETKTLSERIPKEVGLLLDSGYQGAGHGQAEGKVRLPKKATKLHPLSQDEKASNRALSGLRVKVEHAIGRLKRFKILSERFRHPLDSYDETFSVIAGLVNFMRIERLGLAIPVW
jgi:hypothetical protein